MLLNSRKMTGSIDRALESDTPYLDTLHILNQAEHDDHQASWTLERGQDLPPQSVSERMVESHIHASAIP